MIAEKQALRIHLGCGDKRLPGFTHVDARQLPGIDHVAHAADLPFDSGTVDLLYFCHGIEHFRRTEIRGVLGEFRRVLKSGGTLRLSCPDFPALIEIYCAGNPLSLISGSLYGGQDYEHNHHYDAYDADRLTDLLKAEGFSRMRFWDPALTHPKGFVDYSSYIIAGIAMSLNIEATK